MKKIVTIKYLNEYKKTTNKKEFISLLLKIFPHLKISTAERRYYDIKKYLSETNIIKSKIQYAKEEKSEPHILKIYMLKDMVRLKTKINRNILYRYGFIDTEINWAIDENIIEAI